MERIIGMIKISLHNHSKFSFDSDSNMSDMIESAIKNKFKIIGFSEHQDFDENLNEYLYLDYEKYSKKLQKEKEKYSDKITILKSIEIDYQSRFENSIKTYLSDKNFDYIIGSVHYLNGKAIDLPKFKEVLSTLKIENIISKYLDEILNLVKSNLFNILGHLDLIKLYTIEIDPIKYSKKLIKIFNEMKKNKLILEINYSSLRKNMKSTYPSKDILELYYKNGNRLITISADAHIPEHLEFNPDLYFIKNIGFNKIFIPNQNKFLEVNI